jgi:hypothetical protein|tara:strand:+ start:247 stop:420 length:174 start_codon:yes stop_codon:yes gene_type:complete
MTMTKLRPYWSKSLNIQHITEHFTKAQLEKRLRKKGVELDKRKSMANLIEENYDILN